MGRVLRRGAAVLGLMAIAAAAAVVLLRSGLLNPSYESLVVRYAGPPSRFVTVDGVRVHLRDEGEGPVIVMVHSSMTDLHVWDRLAAALIPHHRVVRFDWPPYGLSVDPSENYGMERAVALLDGVVRERGLSSFVLVGSSSGATLATIYAAQHPDRVRALAVSSLPLALPPGGGPHDWRVDTMLWLQRRLFPDYMPRIFYDWSLGFLYGDRRNLRPEDAQWYYETNNIPGRYRRIRQYLTANMASLWRTGAGDRAAMVVAPVLLQWGDADPVLPAALGDKAKADFAKAEVTLIHYPAVGHYPMLEMPDRMAADLGQWLEQHAEAAAVQPPSQTQGEDHAR